MTPRRLSARKIRAHLALKAWAQSDLAAAIGDSSQHVSRVLTGKIDPQSNWVARVADALGVGETDLYEGGRRETP
jgi:predicted transcriptional regulator